MGSVRKHTSISRCAVLNFISALLTALFPLIIQRSFYYGYFFLMAVCSFSSFHVVNINRRTIFPKFLSWKNESDGSQNDRGRRNSSEGKAFQVVFIILLSICFYYLLSIIFGAPVFAEYFSTLYFSCLMTLLTVYPLIWYWYSSQDGVAGVFRVFLDGKYENLCESHLRTVVIWTVVGAWTGAFPIPLDWDKSWQEWPMTCCIGATVGCSLSHLFIGLKLFYAFYYEKKRFIINLGV